MPYRQINGMMIDCDGTHPLDVVRSRSGHFTWIDRGLHDFTLQKKCL